MFSHRYPRQNESSVMDYNSPFNYPNHFFSFAHNRLYNNLRSSSKSLFYKSFLPKEVFVKWSLYSAQTTSRMNVLQLTKCSINMLCPVYIYIHTSKTKWKKIYLHFSRRNEMNTRVKLRNIHKNFPWGELNIFPSIFSPNRISVIYLQHLITFGYITFIIFPSFVSNHLLFPNKLSSPNLHQIK